MRRSGNSITHLAAQGPRLLQQRGAHLRALLTDDLTFKHDFKQIDGSLPQALRFVLAHTGLKAGLAERFRAIIHIFRNGGEITRELIETRCHRDADIARKMRFSEAVALGIRNLDEHWDGGGKPRGYLRSVRSILIRSRCATVQ